MTRRARPKRKLPGFLGLGNGSRLAHRSEHVELGPHFDDLAALVKAVYLDARKLHPIARASNTEEIPPVGAAKRPAAHYLVVFG